MGYSEAQYAVNEIISGLRKNSTSGVEPDNMTDIALSVNSAGKILITFEVADTVVFGQTICRVKGVIIRRKIGSAPTDEFDGDLVGNFMDEQIHAHVLNPIVDIDLVGDTYYRFFPYSDTGVLNKNRANIAHIDASKNPSHTMIVGFHQDFNNLDPDTCITYIASSTHFTPMHTNKDTGAVTEGSWGQWEWLKKNLPYIVNHSTGKAVKQLDPNDYTKYIDGTASPVATNSTTQGAYAWLPRLYMKEVYAADGNSRDVYFAMNNTSEETKDFYKAPGFYHNSGDSVDMQGLWLPMFYLVRDEDNTDTIYPSCGYNRAQDTPNALTKSAEGTESAVRGINTKLRILGGPIMNTLRDLFFMFYRSTNVQEKGGYGKSYYHSKSSLSGNVIQPGGRFYGTGPIDSSSSQANKALHSIVLFGYTVALLDPYTLRPKGGKILMSHNYSYNSSGTGYKNTNVVSDTDAYTIYPSKLVYVDKYVGSIIDTSGKKASSVTGLCDSVYLKTSGNTSTDIAERLACNSNGGAECGPGYIRFYRTAGNTHSTSTMCGYGVVCLPPAGYSPS